MSKNNNSEAAVLDTVFEDNLIFNKKGYKDRKLTKEELELNELYNSIEINSPEVGSVVNLKYVGKTADGDTYLFDGNYKDYIRVDAKGQEKTVMSNISVGENIDVLITSIGSKDNMFKGSVSSIHIKHVIGHVIESNPAGYTVDIVYQGNKMKCFMPNYLAGINKISDPKSLVGQKLEVILENYDFKRRSGVVSRRKYLETLIEDEIKTIEVGSEYTGSITDKTDYGVFVEFKQSLTGMIHKSNLSPDTKLSDLKPGDDINFFVREIIDNKIILTQTLKETAWDTIQEGQVYQGRVLSSKKVGFLVALDDSTTGMIRHIDLEESNMSVTEGETVNVEVVAFNKKARIITLKLIQ